jgi:hypothetical protein
VSRFGSLQLCCETGKIRALIPLAEFDRRLAVINLLTRVLARGDAVAAGWHDHRMVLSPAASVTVHRLPATPSTVHWGYFDPRLEPVLTVDQRQGVHGRIAKHCFPHWTGIPA